MSMELLTYLVLGAQALGALGIVLYVWARRRTIGPSAWHARRAKYHLARARAWQAYEMELEQAERELGGSYVIFERAEERV